MPVWQSVQAILSWVVLFLKSSWQLKQSSDGTAAQTGELRIRKMMTRIGIVSHIEQERRSTRGHHRYFIVFVKKNICNVPLHHDGKAKGAVFVDF